MAPSPASQPEPRQAAAEAASARALARSPAQAFRHGMIQSMPFLIVVVPFAMLFGVVALEAGIDVAEVLGFSVLVLAGASQFTAVQLMSDNAPAWVVILSGLAVNLRMAMYSASLVPWLKGASGWQRSLVAYTLIDQTYAVGIQHYEHHPRLSLTQRLAFFFGAAVTMCVPWIAASWLGAALGRNIPDALALDFAMPITFLAMIAPMLRTKAHLAACLVSIIAALLLAGLPSGVGMIFAAILGMATGAVIEVLIERRQEDGS